MSLNVFCSPHWYCHVSLSSNNAIMAISLYDTLCNIYNLNLNNYNKYKIIINI